jgi:hypothetical protein
MKQYNLYIILFASCINYLFAIDTIELTKDSIPQTLNNPVQIRENKVSSEPDSIYQISKNEFMFADTRRCLIDGSLPLSTTKIKPVSATIFGAALTGLFVVQHEMQQNTIWKNVSPKFNIAEDYKYSLGADKFGHFYGAYMPSYFMSQVFMSTGFGYDLSHVLGGTLGLLYTSYVEVLDGYSKDFGFSPSDWYADFAGSAFFVAQHYIPVLQNFQPKFMYVKPSWIGEKNRREAESFIDDYSAQTFWMSINVHNLLPKSIENYWPDFLELSVGYAVYSLCTPCFKNLPCDPVVSEPVSRDAWGNRTLLIGLDYNLVKLLPDDGAFWNWLKQSLNLFRFLPAPTLEIGRTTRFYLTFPFPIKIGNIRF